MSYGIRDEDWVDPPERIPLICKKCIEWNECPHCGEYGWCEAEEMMARWDDQCE